MRWATSGHSPCLCFWLCYLCFWLQQGAKHPAEGKRQKAKKKCAPFAFASFASLAFVRLRAKVASFAFACLLPLLAFCLCVFCLCVAFCLCLRSQKQRVVKSKGASHKQREATSKGKSQAKVLVTSKGATVTSKGRHKLCCLLPPLLMRSALACYPLGNGGHKLRC
jgi:hypothetical protein